MRWRSQKDDPAARAEKELEGQTIGRVRDAQDGAAAVLGALALYELHRPVARLGIADVGEGQTAEEVQRVLAAQRETVYGQAASLALDGLDGVVAVAPSSLPADGVLSRVERFGDLLVGVLVVEADGAAPPAAAPARGDEYERRLAELSARESALRKITEAVQKGHGGVSADELAALELRAERAEARVAELEAQLGQAARPAPPAAPAPAPAAAAPAPPPPVRGRPTLAQLEALVDDAYRRGAPEAEEWSVYVPLLREHAAPDGTLPDQFDSLIQQVFGSALR